MIVYRYTKYFSIFFGSEIFNQTTDVHRMIKSNIHHINKISCMMLAQSLKIHTSARCDEIRKLARLRVVDNSEIGKRVMAEGKPPRCIHVYNKCGVGLIGDKVLVAIKGQMRKGILVGLKQNQKPKVPKFDSNNLILIDDSGSPIGTRIHVPIPTILRTILKERSFSKGADYTKILAIANGYL